MSTPFVLHIWSLSAQILEQLKVSITALHALRKPTKEKENKKHVVVTEKLIGKVSMHCSNNKKFNEDKIAIRRIELMHLN